MIDVLTAIWNHVLGSPYGIGQILFRATPLILCALGAAVSFRSGLFNIGLEGQLLMGSLAGALTGVFLADFSSWLGLPLIFLATFSVGALFALAAGLLKVYRSVHEVVSTMMMNFVAIGITNFFTKAYCVPETTHTQEIGQKFWMAKFSAVFGVLGGSAANMLFILAILLTAAFFYVMTRTRFGLETKAMGYSLSVASYSGINIARRTLEVMVLSGGLAALGGLNFVLGHKHYFEMGFSSGVGFLAISVSLIGGNHPAGIVLAGLFFAFLEESALAINIHVPKEAIQVFEALLLMILLVILSRKARLRTA